MTVQWRGQAVQSQVGDILPFVLPAINLAWGLRHIGKCINPKR